MIVGCKLTNCWFWGPKLRLIGAPRAAAQLKRYLRLSVVVSCTRGGAVLNFRKRPDRFPKKCSIEVNLHLELSFWGKINWQNLSGPKIRLKFWTHPRGG
jgi:hypothetical protein